MRGTASGRIFLSYRRDDTRHIAGRLADRLAERFGHANVFMDVDSIEPGLDFSEAIERAVGGCDVLLALIGTRWLSGTDEHGQRRLDDPDDLVLLEIKSALDRDIRVIPVLVDGAAALRRDDLPKILAQLARRNAVRLDHETFRTDVGPLIDVLDRAVRAASPTATHVAAEDFPEFGPEPGPVAEDSPIAAPPVGAVPARDFHEDTLTHYRRVLGDDHPDTLTLANNLAAGLSALGKHQWVCELDEDILTRFRRVLGDDHPSTLASANNLATGLRALGEHQWVCELDEDILARFRRVLGDDHPSTLASANNLATDLNVGELGHVYDSIVRCLLRGRVVPVLGTGINLCERPPYARWERGRYLPSGQELADELAQYRGDVMIDGYDLARVSQYVAEREGEGSPYGILHGIFDTDYPPTLLHRFLARLTREAKDVRECMLIVTANYDDSLERAFADEGEPYQLLTYIAEGGDRGLFRHVTADGEPTVIQKPNVYDDLRFDQRTVIAKVLGSVDRIRGADSFVITEDDHIDYATRADIAGLFPFRLAAKLRTSHSLFLGYSLRDRDFRMMLRRLWEVQEGKRYNSWAIQNDSDPIDRAAWDKCGVDILSVSVENFVGKHSARMISA